MMLDPKPSVPDLILCIQSSWDEMTSANPDQWNPRNPARGQCAVTACIVQEVYGGDLLRALVNDESHYWNRLPGGTELDLTIQQYGLERDLHGEVVVREREYVLDQAKFPMTVSRYDLLKQRVIEKYCELMWTEGNGNA